jgi:quinohemoprotein ethanol dehydrogenase
VALHQGKVFVGAYDGRMIALDAVTGQTVWEKDTIIDRSRPYTITGAPRVFQGQGHHRQRWGRVWRARLHHRLRCEHGDQKWRWFTVPGDPSKPFEDASMAKAAKTWDPSGKYWEAGGGGTAWDTLTFDPQLNLMYVGTGNGSPWARSKRSPAGGDNLYLASIVALNPDTGAYVWHYQETPGDNWDYTSTQPMILADLKIGGQPRKVILHAPKNGFFLRDRPHEREAHLGQELRRGELGHRLRYERPAHRDGRGPLDGQALRQHSRPVRRPQLAIDVVQSADRARLSARAERAPEPDGQQELDDGRQQARRAHGGLGWNVAMFANVEPPKSKPFGRLIAWDPVRQKEAWRQEQVSPWNGGTLTTAGNLVFQGTADGRFIAYNAKTGEKLWESATGTGVVAAPSTYLVDGKQYVSIAVGWGGVYGLSQRATDRQGPGTVYTFALGGTKPMPEFVKYRMDELIAGVKYDPAHVKEGTLLYVSNCVFCHGVPGVDRGGNIPNLAYMKPEFIEHLDKSVFDGPASERGMPNFTGKLSPDDVEKIKAFIQGTADAIRPKK